MMTMRALLFGIGLLVAVPASARDVTVSVTVFSDPLGATVYANTAAQRAGYSPVLVKYKFNAKAWKSGACQPVQPIKVRWVSGAEATLNAIRVCPANGTKQELTFMRPDGMAGVEVDASFAIELQRISAGQASAAYAAAQAAAGAVVVQKPVYCTSRLVGSRVFTTCL